MGGQGVAGGASGEEAAWRDLIANYAAEPATDDGADPWPERENLVTPRRAGPLADAGPDTDPALKIDLGDDTDPALDLGTEPSADPGANPNPGGGPGAVRPGSQGGGPVPRRGTGSPASQEPGPPPGQGTGPPPSQITGPSAGQGTGPVPGNGAHPGPAGDTVSRVGPGPPRVVRPANSVPPPADGEDFVPPVPPPLPSLDPIAKGAWAALFGGPGYLLIATMAGWQVPGWLAFLAVAAFVGGFATLVIRMGDKPPRDSGPDDGAVL